MAHRGLLRHHLATAAQASASEIAAIIRGHPAIEDRLHWVRDMYFDEDRSMLTPLNAATSVMIAYPCLGPSARLVKTSNHGSANRPVPSM